MIKIMALAASGLLGLTLAALAPAPKPPLPGDPPPPPEKGEPAKKKGHEGPIDDLRHAYDLLRKLKAGEGSVASGEAVRADWVDRAIDLYRRALKEHKDGDDRLTHEYAVAAHDLARAVDHVRLAALMGKPADELPPPPEAAKAKSGEKEIRHDLRHAHDRLSRLREGDVDADARYYLDAARDLYNDALKEARGDDPARAREMAKAAEALSHVPEHLGHAIDGGPAKKAKRDEPKAKRDEHKGKHDEAKAEDDDGFPPPLR